MRWAWAPESSRECLEPCTSGLRPTESMSSSARAYRFALDP
jgi:hypothetical protein